MNDIAIKVENLSKYYRLGVIKAGTIKDDFQSWFFKALGKEDTNKKLDSKEITDKGFWALKDINFEIKKGDRVGIIGKNGAGKSTLLKMISRISAPTEGRIYINGRVASLLEVGTGFNPELTGRENIFLNGAILGMKKREVQRKLDEIIAFSEIEQHIDTPVKRYSSGMYVRLAFAVAAHLDSEILIADEVLAVGDAAFQKKALGKMNDLSTGQGRTVLFVSHNMDAVKSLCNRGIVLEKGKILRVDTEIKNSINYYLGIDISEDKHPLLWENKDTFKNEYFEPSRFYFTEKGSDKISNSVVDYNKDYIIHLIVTVKKPSSNVDFWIKLYKGLEFITTMKSRNYSFHEGENVFTFNFNKRIFTPGNYRLIVCSSLKQTEWILNPDSSDILMNFTISGIEEDYDIWGAQDK